MIGNINHDGIHFLEIINYNEKWDIGVTPIKTCISWENGEFKNTLPSLFYPHIKVLKIIKNNKIIGRTILSLHNCEKGK